MEINLSKNIEKQAKNFFNYVINELFCYNFEIAFYKSKIIFTFLHLENNFSEFYVFFNNLTIKNRFFWYRNFLYAYKKTKIQFYFCLSVLLCLIIISIRRCRLCSSVFCLHLNSSDNVVLLLFNMPQNFAQDYEHEHANKESD